jgi:hypothetical protein
LSDNALGQVGAEQVRDGERASSQRVVDVVVMVDRAFEVTFVSLGLHDYPVRYVPVRGGIDAFAAY